MDNDIETFDTFESMELDSNILGEYMLTVLKNHLKFKKKGLKQL